MIKTKRHDFQFDLKIKGVSIKANILKISEDGKTVQKVEKTWYRAFFNSFGIKRKVSKFYRKVSSPKKSRSYMF